MLRFMLISLSVASLSASAWSDLQECEVRSAPASTLLSSEITDSAVSFESRVVDPLVALGRPSRNEMGRPLLFFFQAFGRAPREFVRSELFKTWLGIWERKLDQDIPRIVVIGWGGLSGALNSVSPAARDKLQSSFLTPLQLRDQVESIFSGLPFATSRVVLIGGSMGAANALQLLRVMPDFFDQAILYALPVFLEFARDVVKDSELSIESLRWQDPATSISSQELFALLQQQGRVTPLMRYLFPNQSYWDDFSPLSLLRKGALPEALKKVPIYLTVGEKDVLGYFPAAAQFAQEMKDGGFQVEWVPIPGGAHGGPFKTDEIVERMSGPR